MDNTSSFPPHPNEAPAPTNKGFLYVAGEAALTSLGLGLYGAMCGGATYAVAGAFTAGMGVGRPAAVMAAFQMGARKIGAGAGTAGAIFPPAFLLAGQNPEQSMIPILVSGSLGALVSAQFPPKGYRKLPLECH
ncbi:hypothetical protein C8R43DRAFT_127636 [Mycena crocata]|nr:hypothetical protein C8R43DRAFT_127636 [Mycena crocata]